MTIADELANRSGCHRGLPGVHIAVGDDGPLVAVRSSHYDHRGELVVILASGRAVPASACHLRTRWPVVCCVPGVKNEWNSKYRQWITEVEDLENVKAVG